MRLTLRTLLAYLDDILDPEDANQLQRKIEDSEFATSLVQQIRGSVRRMRLDAPALDAQGIGGDLNSVAEYLDNVLPPEHVPALEKACLDNDVNLGEVASCHQVLTLVLGEPATFTDAMRQRAYGIAPTVPHTPLPPSPHYGEESSAAEHGDAETPVETTQAAAATTTTAVTSPKEPPSEASTVSASTPEPATTDSPAPPASEVEKTETHEARPSDDVAVTSGILSTKEAWRAEGQDPTLAEEFAKAATGEVATKSAVGSKQRTVAVPIPGSETAAGGTPAQAEFPDYMDRRRSWLRSAFVTGVMALFLLLGLLFATNPAGKTYLAGWLGSSRAVATNAPNDPNATSNVAAEFANTNPAAASEATPSLNVAPDVTLSENVSSNLPSTGERFATNSATQTAEPTRWANADAGSHQGAENAIPNFATTETIESPIVPEVPELNIEVHDQLATNSETAAAATTPALLPTVGPADNVAVVQDENQNRLENAEIASVDVDVPAENGVALASTDLPPRNNVPDLLPDVPLDPTSAADTSSIARANIARGESPLQLDSSASVDELSIPADPQAVPINPPIAAPTTSITAANTSPSIQIPETPTIDVDPDLDSTAELGPTRLRRGGELALIYDAITDDWKRVDSTKPLQLGDSIQCLPSYRTTLSIGDSTDVTMVDATRVQLGPYDNVTLEDGKLLVRFSQANASQRFRFRDKTIEITAKQAGSTVAIEGARIHQPGTDLEAPTHALLKVYPINGSSVVSTRGREFELVEGKHFLSLDQYLPRLNSHAKLPAWREPITATRKYRDAIAASLKVKVDQSVREWHKDRSNSTKAGQRALAARCLAETGDYSAIVQAFADKGQRAYWTDMFTTLRHVTTKGPDEVAKLQLELEKTHGVKASLMMELVRGYSAEQLSNGAARKLVELLSNEDNLEYRILAIENLKRIKGADHNYAPGQTKAKRRTSINTWENRLADNEVKYKETPEILQLLEQFAREQAGG